MKEKINFTKKEEKMVNKNLIRAKKEKNDEFYTKFSDIENELIHYRKHFKGKIIFLNCDNPYESNFWKYFHLNFDFFGLKKLIATHYVNGRKSFKFEYMGGDDNNIYSGLKTNLKGDGDFRSNECVELLKESDIVVGNPPFSLFLNFINQLIKYNKNFIIIGNQNAITYKDVFPLIKENRIWLGVNAKGMEFEVPNKPPYNTRSSFRIDKETGKFYQKLGNICWFTNLEHYKRNEELILWKLYNEKDNPKYDNYDAIEVSRVKEIPKDYYDVMGVPITFLNKYNPNQFEILGCTESEGKGFSKGLWDKDSKIAQPLIKGKRKYKRLFIRILSRKLLLL